MQSKKAGLDILGTDEIFIVAGVKEIRAAKKGEEGCQTCCPENVTKAKRNFRQMCVNGCEIRWFNGFPLIGVFPAGALQAGQGLFD